VCLVHDARGLLPPTSKMRFDPSQKRCPLAAYKYQSLTHIEEFKYVNLGYETLENNFESFGKNIGNCTQHPPLQT